MGRTHVLAVPYPLQGHVIPLIELSKCLVQQGFRVTFVNTDHNHKRVLNALTQKDDLGEISLVSIPDGLQSSDDRNDLAKLAKAIFQVMPGELEELINRINANSSEDEKIKCLIADWGMGWVFEVSEKMKIRRAAFWTPPAAILTPIISIQKLIDDQVIDNDGTPLKNEMIQLAPGLPTMNTTNFLWCCLHDLNIQKFMFNRMIKTNKALKETDFILCNSAYDLEPGAFSFDPRMVPIGPLLASNRLGESGGCFWEEDSTCLKWLDQQPPKSVIYVAFGSLTVFDRVQFQELALGLELSCRPFLWVVRPDITKEENAFPEGFQERVAERGCMVDWTPQQKVLAHPSIACFLTHCGWNSTMEGVGNGVPLLCWPYFADQFVNETYICDVWKVGLKFDKDKQGIITRDEIRNKVEEVFADEKLKERASEIKETALGSVGEGGSSYKSLRNFIEWVKG
ncbi:UDP-glycosyltransferase 83A1-like [Euphorbia lathyris]|uniref:UDP-glycosyltransferase 83A1-like n=1 Tax=Euphorbia lathyris TaxID=212925 RepID=UPI003313AA95